MSSVEIHERTGKRHDNVMRDIRTMFDALGLNPLSFEGVYTDAKGEQRPCFHLPKDLTLTLITGYSIPLRAAVVKRWQELEAQQAPTLPNFANPAEAARAWASEYGATTGGNSHLLGSSIAKIINQPLTVALRPNLLSHTQGRMCRLAADWA